MSAGPGPVRMYPSVFQLLVSCPVRNRIVFRLRRYLLSSGQSTISWLFMQVPIPGEDGSIPTQTKDIRPPGRIDKTPRL